MTAAEPISNGDETILYVEDDAEVRETVELLLEALDYNLLTATSGAEAYERLRDRDDIDLLFSDVIMPGGMNGVELAEKAREMRPELEVLLTSGYTDSAA